MLGIDGNDLVRPLHRGEDERTARDERLLVREGEGRARSERGERRAEPHRARHAVEDHIGPDSSRLGDGRLARLDPDAGSASATTRAAASSATATKPDTELARLGNERVDAAAPGGERDHVEAVAIAANDVERLGPDRPRRAQHRDGADRHA